MRVLLIALLAAISYAQTGCKAGCNDVCITSVMTTTKFANEESWQIEGSSCSGPQTPPYPDDTVTTEYCCISAGTYTITCKDSFADGWDGATLAIEGETICSLTRDDGAQITKTITIKAPPSAKGSGGGLSGGWIFIIILIVLTFVYCVGGMAYNYRYSEDVSTDEGYVTMTTSLIPQKEMWTKVPHYTRTGCQISYQCLNGLYHRYILKDEDAPERVHKRSSI